MTLKSPGSGLFHQTLLNEHPHSLGGQPAMSGLHRGVRTRPRASDRIAFRGPAVAADLLTRDLEEARHLPPRLLRIDCA